MNATISYQASSSRPEPIRTTAKKKHSSAMFSRAAHFALALVPFTLALSSSFVIDYFSRARFEVTYAEPLKAMLVTDASAWFHWFVFALFLFGVGGAVATIHAVNRVEAREKSQP